MERFSVTKAVQNVGGGVVAKSDRFEVWARRHRAAQGWRRVYHTSFTAIEVLTKEPPRKTREIELPDNMRSNLDKIIAFLESLP